jgi:hypothetical protein
MIECDEYTDNDVITSFKYYNSPAFSPFKELIEQYKAEMDPYDWVYKPLQINFTVVNWILTNRTSQQYYPPDLVTSGVLTREQLESRKVAPTITQEQILSLGK